MYKILDKIDSPSYIKSLNLLDDKRLCVEIRDYLLNVVAKNGGHLSSNLGIVELTLAIHKVYDSPKDKIIFDVGHQAYVHKLLTGRFKQFDSLRQFGGMSGFLKCNESDHDVFQAGHSSTSISAALGMAMARDIKGEDNKVIAVIGDGAMTGGMAFEALNHAGHSGTDVTVILNDNEMSISENVGGLSKYLGKFRTNKNYKKAKKEVEAVLEKIPSVGKSMVKSVSKIKDGLKQLLVPGMLFEELGLTYIGPIDGHDLKTLYSTLEMTKELSGPVIIHVKTTKGKGYVPAEKFPDKFHGVGSFDLKTGLTNGKSKTSFSKVFGDTMLELAETKENMVAITAAMPSGTGLSEFMAKYPNKFIDVGIAEQHAVTLAAGLATEGIKSYFTVYSTFLQRAYDQILHDVCIQNLPAVFAIDRAGLVGNDGETHHGVFDISYLYHIPNMTIMAPTSGSDLKRMLLDAYDYTTPVAIRYPRGEAFDYEDVDVLQNIVVDGDGKDFAILAIGNMYHVAKRAIEILKENKTHGKLICPKIIKPLDMQSIELEIKDIDYVYTMEDNAIIGGFGQYFKSNVNKHGNMQVKCYGMPDEFVGHGDVEDLFKCLGLDADSIANSILKDINK